MMKFKSLLIALAFVCSGLSVSADDGDLFVFGEIPLMNSMTVVADSDIQFDKPSGRIMKTTVEFNGPVDAPDRKFKPSAIEFYERAMPQLGWEKIDPTTYRREGEILTFNFPGDAPQNMIVTLRPTGSDDGIRSNQKMEKSVPKNTGVKP